MLYAICYMLYAIYTGFGQPIVQGWILEREQKINGHIGNKNKLIWAVS